MYDRHNKDHDAAAMMSVAGGMESNKSEAAKVPPSFRAIVEEGAMMAKIYAGGEITIEVTLDLVGSKVVALEPEEASALYGFLKQHYENEDTNNARPEI